MNLLRNFRYWFRSRNDHRFSNTKFISSRSDLPDSVGPHDLYVVGTKSNPKWIVMKCPCNQGHVIDVCLMRNIHPHWRLRLGRNLVATLSPSVWVKNGCRSHFWLVRNRVRWVREFGPVETTD